MAIIGFNYNKIQATKKKSAAGSIKINNNAKITGVKASSISIGTTEKKAIVIDFEFSATYEPGVAQLLFEGSVIITDTDAKLKQILDEWKKDKKVSTDVGAAVLNHVLSKCTIQGLILSKEMNLPPPIKLPKIGVSKTKK